MFKNRIYRTINTPTLITSDIDAVKYFGKPKDGFTIPQALESIFDQGSGIVLAVNVYNPQKHNSIDEVKLSDIIGGVDSETYKRTGLSAFEDCYSLFGYYPKTIIAPTYCEDNSVTVAINKICNKIRAIGIVDAPVGTTVQEAIKGRGSEGTINFNTSSERLILCYPHVKVYDSATDSIKLQPYSQRLAGVIAAKDVSKGYHWSPSNTEIQGIIGIERQLTSMINDSTSEVNQLNEAGIMTIFNSYGSGMRTWGNRSAAYPTNTDPTNFINVRRTADILHESVEYLKHGCNAFDTKRPSSTPMGFWTEQDVLQYIKEKNIPYCSVYGEILQDKKGKWYAESLLALRKILIHLIFCQILPMGL